MLFGLVLAAILSIPANYSLAILLTLRTPQLTPSPTPQIIVDNFLVSFSLIWIIFWLNIGMNIGKNWQIIKGSIIIFVSLLFPWMWIIFWLNIGMNIGKNWQIIRGSIIGILVSLLFPWMAINLIGILSAYSLPAYLGEASLLDKIVRFLTIQYGGFLAKTLFYFLGTASFLIVGILFNFLQQKYQTTQFNQKNLSNCLY
ncbi:MAG: hypothetical protein F6K23_36665 [Okeania sp. SIO2C9]|uniref:hypothetical protein n=1 Tax=Okeania sp. SIO2C9 TaxID=2607791 RepID=UPI0013C05EC1|nr:hypothetical protein [Okeania sp. SIO2C9]NEQ78055.1 hypothetical protein [Okeania sp. SIO2C9]